MNASAFNRKKSTETGFTLVEIAIVLVIIGLLLGGILKGQEMITQAKIKNAINDFNGINVAVTSYQDRYRALPGDDLNATTRWTVQAPGKGNGDGVMLGKYKDNDTGGTGGAPADLKESNLFWQHLRIAGFVPGLTTGTGSGTPPPNAAGGLIGVENAAVGVSGLGFTSLIVCSSNLPDKDRPNPGHGLRGNRRESVPGLQDDLAAPRATVKKPAHAGFFVSGRL